MKKEFKNQLNYIIDNTKPLSKEALLQNCIVTSKRLIIEIENLDNSIMEHRQTINENKIIIYSIQLELMLKELKELSGIMKK